MPIVNRATRTAILSLAMVLLVSVLNSLASFQESGSGLVGLSTDEPPPLPAGASFTDTATDLAKGASVGYLPGDLKVSANGDASYAIPLDVPVGPGGLQPP